MPVRWFRAGRATGGASPDVRGPDRGAVSSRTATARVPAYRRCGRASGPICRRAVPAPGACYRQSAPVPAPHARLPTAANAGRARAALYGRRTALRSAARNAVQLYALLLAADCGSVREAWDWSSCIRSTRGSRPAGRPIHRRASAAFPVHGGRAHPERCRRHSGACPIHDLAGLQTLLAALSFGQGNCDRLDTSDSLFNRVARDLSVNMKNHWRPDAAFFGKRNREQLVGIAKECGYAGITPANRQRNNQIPVPSLALGSLPLRAAIC